MRSGFVWRRLLSKRLSRFPETRLARLLRCRSKESILELCDDYNDSENEFYFDRNPALFPYVLHFYNTGRLHVMDELCIFSFSQEIEYWGIDELFLDSCCSGSYHCRRMEPEVSDWEERSEEASTTSSFHEILDFYSDAGKFDKQLLGSVRRRIWLMLDNPGYSIPSRLISIFSILVVLGSIASMCMNSMSEFTLLDADGKPREDPRFEAVEHFGIGWFTLARLARFTVAPDLLHFFEHPLNLMSILSILPFYLTLLMHLRQTQLETVMRSCDFDGGVKEAPSVNLRNYYAHKVKTLMASLSNMSRSSPSDHSLNMSLH
ncbi:potassium voltage-gated channel subfamily S member 2-like [Sinocyclocheilus anshuiensis]|uniref:potassium voltage-gated channel subfamily S member 2-like n=1 Tax=Sinocyclocheilus anshuiensis TaxID=1608454 RepID=UPI0007B852DE|nr:PREDICTED: potassium voltage-gated channel subfamily S member 2-like [Sinocyclocheilus anshuiensis]